ncbi:dienelactone hydrolase family protein [Bradyrhizobium tropiciagri]|uniref:dienelactone hydrolase family protein n=1 Tax=Bradyrhizobium tropiciagri TaxID=312253 RepID=UPI00067BB6BD|nr:alpha/beta hydrolase [Bradyrhizobium tropiciagri]
MGVRLVLLLVAFACGAASSAWSDELTEMQATFPVTVGGNTFRLEGLIIRKTDAQGRLPIALLTNGGAATATGGVNATAAAYAHYARDLARRGWLAVVTMRRGFGQSEGPKPAPITCQAASLDAWAGAAADDLQATIDTIAKRPDADASKVIVIGSEIAGVAAVALSARNPPGLVSVVSVSGGLQSESNCPINDLLVEGYKSFGAKSRVPNLWIYSSSDRLFGPDLAERLHTAFLDAGGDVKFVMFFHDGNVGTAVFGQATEVWYVQMDGFLRAHNLPTWRTTDVWSVIDRLKITDRMERQNFAGSMIQHYFAAPGEKAIAISPTVQAAWTRPQDKLGDGPPLPLNYQTGSRSLDDARNGALAACQKAAQDCAIVMENFHWVGDTR